ncbi:non-ribosomal peptide synthetase [Streptantibioticus silvisoli]|uniref:Amino acid adenylation domain-containing protein n=1 Tax=Streptantibioticus silvisoli TaxID=2705255 RepID=A0ABT6W9N1_9ACTN|nr:amino acid adenylation domain-containing protein [Streptantibioticus silvisoli]MDI5966363.1 amino acid adenylation domain-containing protein [Streptantibioticus silvisoli]
MTGTERQVVELPASVAQQALWLVDQVGRSAAAYSIACVLRIDGAFSLPAARTAFETVVRRHESLRTAFKVSDGELLQVIDDPDDDEPVRLDLTEHPVAPDALHGRLTEEAGRPFDLVGGPLLRVRILTTAPDSRVLMLLVHHIVVDGTSMSIVLDEFEALYNAAVAGTAAVLPEVAFQYADFAHWQRERLTAEAVDAHTAFWRERLAGAPVLDLPTDRPRPPVQSHHGLAHRFRLPTAVSARLRELARDERATLFATLFAVHQVLVSRYARTHDVCVGVPLSTRSLPEVAGVVGLFVNLTVFRVAAGDNPTFRELIGRVRDETLDAVEHAELPFPWLVERLGGERDLSRNPLFQTTFSVEPLLSAGMRLTGAEVTPVQLYPGVAKFDLGLAVEDDGTDLFCVLDHDATLFDFETVERMGAQYVRLAEQAAADPDTRIDALDQLPPAERRELLTGWNGTAGPPCATTAAEAFAARADATPDAPAVLADDATVTYRELDERANRLAHLLREAGVGPEDVVGVCVDRSPAMITTLLAVLKAGGAYLPLVSSHPVDRLRHVAREAGARVVVTTSRYADRFAAGHHVVSLDGDAAAIAARPAHRPRSTVRAENLAYVIYTSGSTGTPKGIAITHRALASLLLDTGRPGPGPGDVRLQLAQLSFDASVWEIFGPLFTGGAIALPREGLPFPSDLIDALARHPVTTLMLIAPQLHLAAEEFPEALDGVRELLVGGDVLSPHHAATMLRHRPGRPLVQIYGPTESTVVATSLPLTDVDDSRRSVPIGLPIAHRTAYVVDDRGALAAVGVPGELWLGGQGLARGYAGAPGPTARQFVADPFGPPGGRLYRTGDLVRRLPSGQLDFLGRLDGQVKVRGFRIETGEIESVLLRHPAVRAAAVIARDDLPGGRGLVAYVVPDGPPPSDAALRAALRTALPEYMVPAAFVPLDALPLTANGKADHRALPAPVFGDPDPAAAGTAPRTPTETAVRDAWFAVLGVPGIARDQKFFEAGGNSLLLAALHDRITTAFPDVPFSLVEMFEFTTVAEIAAVLDDRRLRQTAEPADFDV